MSRVIRTHSAATDMHVRQDEEAGVVDHEVQAGLARRASQPMWESRGAHFHTDAPNDGAAKLSVCGNRRREAQQLVPEQRGAELRAQGRARLDLPDNLQGAHDQLSYLPFPKPSANRSLM